MTACTDDKGRTCDDPALASVVATTTANANHHRMTADACEFTGTSLRGGDKTPVGA